MNNNNQCKVVIPPRSSSFCPFVSLPRPVTQNTWLLANKGILRIPLATTERKVTRFSMVKIKKNREEVPETETTAITTTTIPTKAFGYKYKMETSPSKLVQFEHPQLDPSSHFLDNRSRESTVIHNQYYDDNLNKSLAIVALDDLIAEIKASIPELERNVMFEKVLKNYPDIQSLERGHFKQSLKVDDNIQSLERGQFKQSLKVDDNIQSLERNNFKHSLKVDDHSSFESESGELSNDNLFNKVLESYPEIISLGRVRKQYSNTPSINSEEINSPIIVSHMNKLLLLGLNSDKRDETQEILKGMLCEELIDLWGSSLRKFAEEGIALDIQILHSYEHNDENICRRNSFYRVLQAIAEESDVDTIPDNDILYGLEQRKKSSSTISIYSELLEAYAQFSSSNSSVYSQASISHSERIQPTDSITSSATVNSEFKICADCHFDIVSGVESWCDAGQCWHNFDTLDTI
jgi:hypothetical protein